MTSAPGVVVYRRTLATAFDPTDGLLRANRTYVLDDVATLSFGLAFVFPPGYEGRLVLLPQRSWEHLVQVGDGRLEWDRPAEITLLNTSEQPVKVRCGALVAELVVRRQCPGVEYLPCPGQVRPGEYLTHLLQLRGWPVPGRLAGAKTVAK